MQHFAPLTLRNIDQERFLPALAEAFAEMTADMVRFSLKHKCRAQGAKAKLTAEIVVCFDGAAPGDFSIKAQIKTSLPARPAVVGKAMAALDQTDEPSLFVQISGSSAADPRQRVLATDDGRTVDPATGEIRDDNVT